MEFESKEKAKQRVKSFSKVIGIKFASKLPISGFYNTNYISIRLVYC